MSIFYLHSPLSAQSFGTSDLDFNGQDGVNNGTSLMFGPDGRLYVLSLSGEIDIYTIQRDGQDDYVVTAAETILTVKNIPNHNDDGNNSTTNDREATGLTVTGTATEPIIYVTSSDPRVGGPSGDQNLDTNSGIISRISWNSSTNTWATVDLVRGLPRSEENHATNGLEFVTIDMNGTLTDFLIVSQGGHANAGAPSDNFAWTPEYALSAAVLSVNLTMLENVAVYPILNDGGRNYIYDIPTLDDPDRPNVNGINDPDNAAYDGIDPGDPFGGNDGLNQAMIVPNGPVQIFSPGYRNTYDLVITVDGKVFVTDNGANGGWGGLPENEGLLDGNGNSLVTNNYVSGEPGSSSPTGGEQVDNKDHLTMVTDNIQTYAFGSFYGGHPTPTRANPTGAGLYTNPTANGTAGALFRTLTYDPDGSRPNSTTNPSIGLPANWPPVQTANPVEGDWRGPTVSNPDGPDDVLITVWSNNTNGIDEYTASNFGGAMQGDLIAGKNGGVLKRVQLTNTNTLANLNETFASNLGGNALGITCNSDSDPFPGTIWVAPFNGSIKVLEPQDFVICILPGESGYTASGDNDSDGYTNQDEIDNKSGVETDEDVICSGSNQPNDFDKSAGGTLVSDLNDPDDDDDGLSDANDPFQLGDPTTAGSDAFNLPVINELLSDNPTLKGYFGLGITGFMNNGAANPNYLNWLDVIDAGPNPNDLLGGATGTVTLQMGDGTADGNSNNQTKGYQYGVNVDQATSAFVVEGRLLNFDDPLQLYGSSAPANGELGLFIGDGTQSNFIKFVLTQNGLEAIQEIGDAPQGAGLSLPLTVANRPNNDIIMRFEVDAITGVVTLKYAFDSGSTFLTLGSFNAGGPILAAIQNANTPLAVGFSGSSKTNGVELEGSWDYLNVSGAAPTIAQTLGDISKIVNDPAEDIDLNNFFDDDNGVGNLTYTVESNTNPAIGASFGTPTNLLTLTYPATAANTDITVRATDGSGLFVEQTFNVDVVDPPSVLYRVNATGPAYTDGDGEVWEADNYFTDGSTYTNASNPIANTTDDVLYYTERYGNFDYSFPVANGDYVVELHFAEIYFGQPGGGSGGGVGSRVFDVNIEGGALELEDYDIFDDVGAGTAVIKTFPITITDGSIDIEFITVTNNAKVSAIAILGAQASGTPITITGTVPDQVNNAGDALIGNLVVIANGGDGNLQYSASGLPTGVFMEPTNGNIYGTVDPGAALGSPYSVTVSVDDSDTDPTDVESFSFNWTINNASVPDLWTDQTDIETYTARHECTFVQAGDKFYLFGGRESPADLDVYDYQAKTWTTIASSAPQDFNHFQALEYQGLIWVIGAFKTNAFPNEVPADFIWAYDPANDVWIQGPAIPTSRKRGSAGLVMYNDKFYVVAGNTDGHDGGYIPWFDEFDPATGVWTPMADAPRARDHFHATVVGDKLYVAGGRESGGGSLFEPLIAEVDVYDFTTNTWSSPTNLPTPRAAAAVINFQNQVYVIGGEIGIDLQGNVIDDALKTTEAYDPIGGSWTTKDDLLTERHGTQGIVSGDGIHIAAGSSSKGGAGTMQNMEFYGTDNPTGTALVASSPSAPTSAIIPTGSSTNINIANTGGNTGIVITDLQLSGPDAAEFSLSGNSFRMIGVGQTLGLIVSHSGTLDNKTANLTITYGDGSTQVIGLASGQSTASILYRVNAGGELVAASDPADPDWSEDLVATPSANLILPAGTNIFQTPAAAVIDMTDPSLPVGTPVSLFSQERWDPTAAPEMTWSFPVTVGQEVVVRLYFAEVFASITAAGERVFDVSIEGSVPSNLSGIDQFARNGLNGAFMLSHTLTMTDGSLDIEFIHGIENPNIKAIEILTAAPVINNDPPVATNPGTQSGVEGDIVSLAIVATDVDDCGGLTYQATGLPGTLTIDPNTGVISGTIDQGTGGGIAGAFIENNGLILFEAETDFVDQPSGFDPLNENGVDFLIATTNHFGNTNGQNITYDLQVANPGVYRIQMKSNFTGTNATEENDCWLRVVNTADVHFFCVQGGTIGSTTEFENILNGGATTKTIYYPAGNAMGRTDHGNENPGNSGYFKGYRSGGGGNKWDVKTIDNNGFPMYAYFPTAGDYTLELSERSAGHKVDRLALTHVDLVSTGVPTATLDGAPSQQAVGGVLGASLNSPYSVDITVTDNCVPPASSVINFDWIVNDVAPNGVPSALVEILPGAGLGSSTFGGNSNLSITNTSTGNLEIVSVSFDFSTGMLPDMVFDPVATGGDATAQCFTPNPAFATATGLIAPADACVDPFSQPYNGGFDAMSMSFSDFDPAEQFTFSVDIDPNSIQGVPGAGGAGSVSGLELTGSTITITFNDGTTLTSSIYEDGSLGGGEAIIAPNALPAPSISAVGVGVGPTCVSDPNQTIELSGTPNAFVSLMVLDTRMYIQSGAAPFVPLVPAAELPYLPNEMMAKALYTAQIGAGGTVQIPVSLLQTTGDPAGSPDGGLNYLVAVVSDLPYAVDQQVSMTSNVLVLDVDPTCAANNASLSINATLQARSDYSGDYAVKLYDPTDGTLLYDLSATADAAGDMIIAGVAPGTYEVGVKYSNSLQKVQTLTLAAGTNTTSVGQLIMGDANNDNLVSLADFSILAFSYNALPASAFFDARADFNGDGIVSALDFSLLAFNYNLAGENPTN
ncbi:MAG: malectin domain-containing carbohydrate-binding protein [Bacteroidia bacterium]